MIQLDASLSGYGGVSASLNGIDSLTVALSKHGSISASLSGVSALNGELQGTSVMVGELTLPKGNASPPYQGYYVVTPKAATETVLPTTGMKMLDDVTVLKIPYYETHGTHGTTIYIANEV